MKKRIESMLFGTFPTPRERHDEQLRYPLIDFCPYCKRDIFMPERPFNMKTDNHLDRCVYEPTAKAAALSKPESNNP